MCARICVCVCAHVCARAVVARVCVSVSVSVSVSVCEWGHAWRFTTVPHRCFAAICVLAAFVEFVHECNANAPARALDLLRCVLLQQLVLCEAEVGFERQCRELEKKEKGKALGTPTPPPLKKNHPDVKNQK